MRLWIGACCFTVALGSIKPWNETARRIFAKKFVSECVSVIGSAAVIAAGARIELGYSMNSL